MCQTNTKLSLFTPYFYPYLYLVLASVVSGTFAAIMAFNPFVNNFEFIWTLYDHARAVTNAIAVWFLADADQKMPLSIVISGFSGTFPFLFHPHNNFICFLAAFLHSQLREAAAALKFLWSWGEVLASYIWATMMHSR